MNDQLHQQLINDLIVESLEGLDRYDNELLALEQGAGGADTLNSIFRVIHTIKGTSGSLGLQKIEKVAHIGENLLSLFREGKLAPTPEMITTLFTYADALREMLHSLETQHHEGHTDYSALLQQIQEFQTAPPTVVAAKPPHARVPAPAITEGWGLFHEEPSAAAPETITAPTTPAAATAALAAPKPPPPQPPTPATHPGWGLFEEEPATTEAATPPVASTKPVKSAAPEKDLPSRSAVSESAIRVEVGQLDRLMNLVGELVLTRNQIMQRTGASKDSAFQAISQRLNLITTELQEGVMKTRMQPIGNIWGKYPRIVRDVAHELGKQVHLEMVGKETELDRTIIEAIKDPLTHIIRNSIDHGIETPAQRHTAGKPEQGLLHLRAYHEGGQVNIEIMDDGAGINVARVKQKSVEKGLITAEQAARMNDREAFNLIFRPGLSTAEKVSNVSGRGVGMDVVKTNIEKIGGSVDVHSEAGHGMTIKIKIPLTLAIIPALIVSSGGERFAIPQVSLLELVRIEGGAKGGGIETVFDAPVYRLRGQLLPLVYLQKVLDRGGGGRAVNHQGDTGEIFVKARGAHRAWLQKLQQVLNGVSTLTREETGSHTLCQLGQWIYSEGLKKYADIPEIHALEKLHTQFHASVAGIVELANAGRKAESEAKLAELEKVSEKLIELLAIAEKRILECQNINIVVLQADGRSFGLVVDAVNDTEEIVVKPLGKSLRGLACFAGATIMGDGRVALILDVMGLAQHAEVISENSESNFTAHPTQTLLLFSVGDRDRVAIPLSVAARLEEFPREKIERAGQKDVVQYRDQILPLIRVSDILQTAPSTTATSGEAPMQVVVYTEQGRSIGLVVDSINDIVETAFTLQHQNSTAGLLGSTVVQGKVTDVLDVRAVIKAAGTGFFQTAT